MAIKKDVVVVNLTKEMVLIRAEWMKTIYMVEHKQCGDTSFIVVVVYSKFQSDDPEITQIAKLNKVIATKETALHPTASNISGAAEFDL